MEKCKLIIANVFIKVYGKVQKLIITNVINIDLHFTAMRIGGWATLVHIFMRDNVHQLILRMGTPQIIQFNIIQIIEPITLIL